MATVRVVGNSGSPALQLKADASALRTANSDAFATATSTDADSLPHSLG
jgi:hypothetical protein